MRIQKQIRRNLVAHHGNCHAHAWSGCVAQSGSRCHGTLAGCLGTSIYSNIHHSIRNHSVRNSTRK
ncbi:hypothetical protein R3P38DRAFT_3367666, partial [Favolaschia claudopus]